MNKQELLYHTQQRFIASIQDTLCIRTHLHIVYYKIIIRHYEAQKKIDEYEILFLFLFSSLSLNFLVDSMDLVLNFSVMKSDHAQVIL